MQKEVELGRAVLKGVSRSFYLSIRLLPRLMREPIALGYLLARASDTIADTEEVDATVRQTCLKRFLHALKDHEQRAQLIDELKAQFVPLQSNDKERLLLCKLDAVWHWYDSVREWAWEAIEDVLHPIVEGQLDDLERFALKGGGQMESVEALEKYTYQVAGCVGEFWTVVGVQAYHRFSHADEATLTEQGILYGKGLQLVNILRDLPQDLKNGRCYLPDVDPKDTTAVMAAAAQWQEKAQAYIEEGLNYAKSLQMRRTRMATVLPALIALETLELLKQASWEELSDGVKVDRKTVRRCAWQAFVF